MGLAVQLFGGRGFFDFSLFTDFGNSRSNNPSVFSASRKVRERASSGQRASSRQRASRTKLILWEKIDRQGRERPLGRRLLEDTVSSGE